MKKRKKHLNSIDWSILEIKYIAKQGVKKWRSWRKLRKAVIGKHPFCAMCGWDKHLEGHHIIPRHVDPSKALDYDNIIVLCKNCHFCIGHWCNFVDEYNIDIEYISYISTRIRELQEEARKDKDE